MPIHVSVLRSFGVSLALACLCCGGDWNEHASEDFHMSYEVPAGGHLDLKNTNGAVEITGWDRNNVEVAGTKYAPERSDLKDVKIDVHNSGNRLEVRTVTPKSEGGFWGNHGGYGATYRIHVPRRFVLDRLETTNGAITAEDLEGGGRITSTNGRINFDQLAGDYQIETTNGTIHGTVTSGAIEATTTNGGVEVSVAKSGDRRPIKASTTNGHIELRLPRDINGELYASTTHGSIQNDLPISTTEQSKHELRGRIGSGGPRIEATTTNGSVRLEAY